MTDPDDNPLALPDAAPPRVGRYAVRDTTLHAEVRGSGPPILLIPGGAEDAEGWRPVAERLHRNAVVTYDRRGTLRSGCEDWPGRGSAQHADDAAELVRAMGLSQVTVLGGSSAGVVALQLALRHPDLVRRALVYEPGYFRIVPDGAAVQAPASDAVRSHLERHPEDWAGAYGAFRAAVSSAVHEADPLAPPLGLEWFARREELDAEPLVRDDIPILTTETVDEGAVAASPVELRFAYGTGSMGVFREIVGRLAAVRGVVPDAIEGVGHALYLHPDAAAAYISAHSD